MPPKRTRTARRKEVKSLLPAPNGALQQYARSIFPIVGVGASAGGIEAVSSLLQNLPEHPGIAVIVVQHQEAKRLSGIPQVLSRVTSLAVTEARENEEVSVDHVYIAPPQADEFEALDLYHATFGGEEALARKRRADAIRAQVPLAPVALGTAE